MEGRRDIDEHEQNDQEQDANNNANGAVIGDLVLDLSGFYAMLSESATRSATLMSHLRQMAIETQRLVIPTVDMAPLVMTDSVEKTKIDISKYISTDQRNSLLKQLPRDSDIHRMQRFFHEHWSCKDDEKNNHHHNNNDDQDGDEKQFVLLP